jgi:mRNA interferase MazF
MVAPARGAVVLVRFPFSDLSDTKLRPAVVLANADRGDWILCQVTSKPYGDTGAIPIELGDFAAGSLRLTSFARPGKLFTASQSLMVAQAGILKTELRNRLIESVVTLPREGERTV